MSSFVTPPSPGPVGDYKWEEEAHTGWISFSGVLLLLLGTMNFVEGIAAISQAHFFVLNTNYVVGSLKTWGWIVLLIGLLQVAVGLGVFVKNQLARWTGVVVLGLNVIAQLLMMPAYPFWSLALLSLDVIAIYGLVAHGAHIGD
jgi:hypothetical protein